MAALDVAFRLFQSATGDLESLKAAKVQLQAQRAAAVEGLATIDAKIDAARAHASAAKQRVIDELGNA